MRGYCPEQYSITAPGYVPDPRPRRLGWSATTAATTSLTSAREKAFRLHIEPAARQPSSAEPAGGIGAAHCRLAAMQARAPPCRRRKPCRRRNAREAASVDYGREVTFGYFLIPNAADPLLDIAREEERRGLDSIGIQDHPYQRRFVDTWTLMSMIAAVTSRVTIFPDVANLPLRPPAVLAKSAASLDLLSGGRFELGLGAGGFWDAIEAYGGPRRSPGEAYAALDEAIDVTRKVWSGERNLRFDGTYYHLGGAHSGANSGPLPAHPIGIWLGVHGPRALRLTGAKADGWVPSFRGEVKQRVGSGRG